MGSEGYRWRVGNMDKELGDMNGWCSVLFRMGGGGGVGTKIVSQFRNDGVLY